MSGFKEARQASWKFLLILNVLGCGNQQLEAAILKARSS